METEASKKACDKAFGKAVGNVSVQAVIQQHSDGFPINSMTIINIRYADSPALPFK